MSSKSHYGTRRIRRGLGFVTELSKSARSPRPTVERLASSQFPSVCRGESGAVSGRNVGAQRTENPFRRSVPKTKSAAKPWKVQPTRLFAFSTRKSGILCFAHTAIIIIVLLAVASLRLVSVSMPATLGCDRTGTATGISFDVGSDTLRPPVRAKRRGGWREGMPKPPDRDVRLRGYEGSSMWPVVETLPKRLPEKVTEKSPQKRGEKSPQKKDEKLPQKKDEKLPQKKDEKLPQKKKGGLPKKNVEKLPETPPEAEQVTRDPVAEICETYMKVYEFSPQDTWGTAPVEIQDSWHYLSCSRILADEGFSLADPPTGGRTRAIIVLWSSTWGWLDYAKPDFVKKARETCSTECVITDDRSLVPVADGVLFHAATHERDFPAKKPKAVKYVFLNLESATLPRVDALLHDDEYMSRFDSMMTYERSSDVPLGYVANWPTSRYFHSQKTSFEEKDGFGDPEAIAVFVSDCHAKVDMRMDYIQELMKYAPVHSYGTCLNNREEPELAPGGGATNKWNNKEKILGHYRFYLAFENNQQTDYVTEKVYNGFQAGTLPIYWGAENVDAFVPEGSIVKTADFKSPKALARHLLVLSEDEEAYEAYFKWRDDPIAEKKFKDDVISRSAYGLNAMCRLCEHVLEDRA